MVARELHILYKFCQLENNCYTIRLVDAQVNKEAYADPTKLTTLYLVTNLEEVDLSKIFSKGTSLNMDQVSIIAYNLLISLNYAHQFGVVHRDLKPNNILINADCQVFLCDFGWSRTILEEGQNIEGKKKRSHSKNFCTRYYRPPEVILGSNKYDFKVDVWSYGCIVAEMYRYVLNQEKV